MNNTAKPGNYSVRTNDKLLKTFADYSQAKDYAISENSKVFYDSPYAAVIQVYPRQNK